MSGAARSKLKNMMICAEFYEIISNIITTLARICPWSETPQNLEKSNLFRRARSSPSHKSADCIIGIVGPPNFGAAGPPDNSTRIDRRRIASKVLVCVITNRALAKQNINGDFDVEVGLKVTNIFCLYSQDGLFTMHRASQYSVFAALMTSIRSKHNYGIAQLNRLD
jgi:hypothetical protein